MSAGRCLSREDWVRYRGGDISEEVAKQVREHLETCEGCSRQAAEFDDQQAEFLAKLRQVARQEVVVPVEASEAAASTSLNETLAVAKPPGDALAAALHIPGHEILGEIHRGGQGVVFQALQRSTKRKVAVKVLREGPYVDRPTQRRFEREIELVGQLKHPNIISLYHSGVTPEGYHFYVMDYVRGLPLNKHVRQKQQSLEETLRLFAKVCDAVHYAHQKGVIHRDLKPSNILVDHDGEPKVLDFGLAKQLAEPMQTVVSLTGQVVGTLPYISPEQATGNPDSIDIRTDVYSLGVILYELLTGSYPYPVSGSIANVLRHISMTAPQPPSRVWNPDIGISKRSSRRLRRQLCPIDSDIDTMILKALAKDSQRRYQGAGELARDIDRYLSGQAIEARRDSGWYVLKKSLQRHRLSVAVAAGFVLLLTLASVISIALYVEAESARALAAARQGKELEARVTAEQEGKRSGQMLKFLQKMLYPVELRQRKGPNLSFKDVLDDATRHIAREFGDLPLNEAEVRSTLGQSYVLLGDFARAEEQLKRALDIRRQNYGELHGDIATSLFALGSAFYYKSEYPTAETMLRESIAMHRIVGSPASDTVAPLSALAWCLHDQRKFLDAEPLFRDILQLGDTNPTLDQRIVASAKTGLGAVLYYRGIFEEAEAVLRDAVKLRRDAVGDREAERSFTANLLAIVLNEIGKHHEARSVLHKSLEAHYQSIGRGHPFTEQTLVTLTNLEFTIGDVRRAQELMLEGLDVRIAALQEKHAFVGAALSQIKQLLEVPELPTAAEFLLRQGITLGSKLPGYRNPHLPTGLENLADHFCAMGRYKLGIILYEETLRLRREIFAEGHLATARVLLKRAHAEVQTGETRKAEASVQEAIHFRRTALPADSWMLDQAYCELGRCLAAQGRFVEAYELIADVLKRLQVNPSTPERVRREALDQAMWIVMESNPES